MLIIVFFGKIIYKNKHTYKNVVFLFSNVLNIFQPLKYAFLCEINYYESSHKNPTTK